MTFTFLVSLSAILSLVVAYQVRENEPRIPLQPGDLLRSLDALTSDVQAIYAPLKETPRKSADRRAYDDDHDSEDDYDRTYEDFVAKYFQQGEEDLDSDDEDERSTDDHAAPYESPAEHNDETEADESKVKKRVSKSKKCKRVEIGEQTCLVCEDPRTNEKSKSCSYSSDSKPKSYGYSKERSSTKSSDDDDDDDDDEPKSTNATKSQKREASKKKDKYQPRKTSIKAFVDPLAAEDIDDSSKCIRRIENGMICYYCGTVTENTRECMMEKFSPKKRRVNESSTRDSKTKKVFKRMVTYSFKNDAEPKLEGEVYEASSGF